MAEIVKFTGGNDELFCRESADNLHAAAQVIVPETHTVLLIKDGIVSEALGAGRHDIFDTENGLFRLKKDSDCASVDFVFISKSAKLPMLWGTPSPIRTRDPIAGVPVAIGINGELEFRVKTPKQFYLELVGVDTEYSVEKLKKRLLARFMSLVEPIVTQVMRDEHISYTEFSDKKTLISKELKTKIGEFFDKEYGLELCSLTVLGAIISDADIMAIERKRDELGANARKCPHCGAAAGATAKFCAECGNPLGAAFCPHCGTKIETAGAKFCPMCGTNLIKK